MCFFHVRHGHNELDDPTFTNPLLYRVIQARKTLPDAYAQQLIQEGESNNILIFNANLIATKCDKHYFAILNPLTV